MFVVSGVTGKTGAVVAQTLIDQGQSVRVIVRSEEKGRSWHAQGAEVAIADLMDQKAMTEALQGVKGAYFLLPLQFDDEAFPRKTHQTADAIVAAAKAAHLPHAVMLSSIGAQHEDRIGPIGTVAYLERQFLAASIPLSAIRPGYFLENILEMVSVVEKDGVYPSMLLPIDRKIDMVATQDIGKVAAEAMLSPLEGMHRVIELKGAGQYSTYDVANEFSQKLGRPIAPIAIPEEGWVDILTQAGHTLKSAKSLAEMFQSINNGRIDYVDNNSRKASLTLSDFVSVLDL